MRQLHRLVKALEGIEALSKGPGGVDFVGARVFPVKTPANLKTWPALVWSRSGGTELPVDFAGGVKLPLISVTVLDTDYTRMDGIMREVEQLLEPLAWTVFDPPDDGWHDELNVYSQTITLLIQQ